jgi:hypothetical protein
MFVRNNLPIAHHDHPVGVGADVGFMGHDDHGNALLAIELADDVHDFVRGARIEITGWFVGQEHCGLVDKRTCQRNALLLATGQLARRIVSAVCQADVGQHRATAVGSRPRSHRRGGSVKQRQNDVLKRAGAGEQIKVLEHKADPSAADIRELRFREMRHIALFKHILAAGRLIKTAGEAALITGYLAGLDRTLIAEVPFNVGKLAELLEEDRVANSSKYAMVVLSEGSCLDTGETLEQGPRDAYGHRKLGGIGEVVGAEIARLTGTGVLNQKLGYLMRAGPPDTLDLMVAKNYGAMVVQLLDEGKRGLMTALCGGNYSAVSVGSCVQGTRRVDVAALYDVEAYRPRIARVTGKPMFLY